MQGKGFKYRLWNRDMAACLNFIQIILSLRGGTGVPTQFHRNTAASTSTGTSTKRSREGGPVQQRTKKQK